jgi:hypothetical protein
MEITNIEGMTGTRLPKLNTSYKPPGKRLMERRLKHWCETVDDHWAKNITG